MPADYREYTVASARESSFAAGPDTDFDTDGEEFLCIDFSVEALRRTMHENRNYRQRVLASYAHILGVQAGQVSFGMYCEGSGTVTSAAANAVTYPLADRLYNAWGGLRLTRANSTQTASASAPEVTGGEGTEYEAGDIIIGVDSVGRAWVVVVDSISTDTLTLRYDAPASITTVAGSVQCYPNGAAMSNRSHSDHVTDALIHQGEDPEDNYVALGVKLVVAGIDALEPDNQAMFQFEGLCADFQHQELTAETLGDAPLGGVPQTVATGSSSFVRLAQIGTDFNNDNTDYAYSATITAGVSSQPVTAIGGTNGRVGYHVDGIDDTMVEIAVEYDDQWLVAFEAGTQYHLLIQVGTVRDDLYAFYFPRLAFAEEPQRSEASGETSIILRFRALEYNGASSATGNELEKYRAKMHFIGGA